MDNLIAECKRRGGYDPTRLSALAGILKKISYIATKRNGRGVHYELTYLGRTTGEWRSMNKYYYKERTTKYAEQDID